MKLYVKAQGESLRGPTIVFDTHNKPKYIVSSHWGLTQDGYTVYTISGDELAEIKQISLGLLPKFELYQSNLKVGSLKRLYGVWHDFVFVSDLSWLVMGDLLGYHYKVSHHSDVIMEMDQASISLGDIYLMDIPNEADEPLCICIAMILDHWAKSRKKLPNLQRISDLGIN